MEFQSQGKGRADNKKYQKLVQGHTCKKKYPIHKNQCTGVKDIKCEAESIVGVGFSMTAGIGRGWTVSPVCRKQGGERHSAGGEMRGPPGPSSLQMPQCSLVPFRVPRNSKGVVKVRGRSIPDPRER